MQHPPKHPVRTPKIHKSRKIALKKLLRFTDLTKKYLGKRLGNPQCGKDSQMLSLVPEWRLYYVGPSLSCMLVRMCEACRAVVSVSTSTTRQIGLAICFVACNQVAVSVFRYLLHVSHYLQNFWISERSSWCKHCHLDFLKYTSPIFYLDGAQGRNNYTTIYTNELP